MGRRRRYLKPKYKRPGRRAAKNEASKARSLQSSYRKATDRTKTLPIKEAREIVADPPVCPYCDKKIPYREISIDHVEPRSKGGSSEPENLVYCDRRCNMAKGNLNGTDFKLLMAFLDEHPSIKESVLPRLIAGGAAFRRRGGGFRKQ